MNPNGATWIGKLRRAAVYCRDGEQCLACGASRGPCESCWLPSCYRLTLDHVIPRALSGSNTPHNLITMCCACNASRGSAPIAEWRPGILSLVNRCRKRSLSRVNRDAVHALAAELWPAWYAREIVGKARAMRNRGNSLKFEYGAAA